MEQTPKTILILAANPEDTTRVRCDKEVSEIKEALKQARYRDLFKIQDELAVQPNKIQRAMLDCNPQIVHFCGHGTGDKGLIFEDETGATKLVDGEALAGLFKGFPEVECVVLNGCYSEEQAEVISQHVKYVIGMKKAIGDKAAIKFAVGFYDALFSERTVEFAYNSGLSAMRLAGIPEQLTPVLKKKSIQSLLKILTDSKNLKIARDIKNAYKACSPKYWDYLKTDEPKEILENIKTMREDSEYTRIQRFVACLIVCTNNTTLKKKLRRWADENRINDFSTLEKQEKINLQEIRKNQNPYLLIKVIPSTQDTAKKSKKENYYFVDAWFTNDGGTLNTECEPEWEPIDKEKEEKYSFTLKEIHEEVIIFFLNKISRTLDFNPDKLTIEIFMPLD
ncbi:MAG: CHAT domain-containing protein, partial [Cyanobacteria bacterium J06629_18]